MTKLPRDVLELVLSIRESKDWDALPILADMLEEAGVCDEDVLNHLRGNRPHQIGYYCWVVERLIKGTDL
jgi:hypothetical protein